MPLNIFLLTSTFAIFNKYIQNGRPTRKGHTVVTTQGERKSYVLYQTVALLVNLSDPNHPKQGSYVRWLKTGT